MEPECPTAVREGLSVGTRLRRLQGRSSGIKKRHQCCASSGGGDERGCQPAVYYVIAAAAEPLTSAKPRLVDVPCAAGQVFKAILFRPGVYQFLHIREDHGHRVR